MPDFQYAFYSLNCSPFSLRHLGVTRFINLVHFNTLVFRQDALPSLTLLLSLATEVKKYLTRLVPGWQTASGLQCWQCWICATYCAGTLRDATHVNWEKVRVLSQSLLFWRRWKQLRLIINKSTALVYDRHHDLGSVFSISHFFLTYKSSIGYIKKWNSQLKLGFEPLTFSGETILL